MDQVTTCSTAGQVRIDAILSLHGAFLGGCNCACPVNHGCPSGWAPNFDPATLQGDCSCVAVSSMTSPPGNPVGGGGVVGGGGGGVASNPQPGMPVQPPRPQQPVEPSPIAMLPPVAVLCTDPGPCECPAGTPAPCHITCDGTDACKDAAISCNNDGFPCSIDCIGMKACASS